MIFGEKILWSISNTPEHFGLSEFLGFFLLACDGKEENSPLAQANVSETRDHLILPTRQPGHNGPFQMACSRGGLKVTKSTCRRNSSYLVDFAQQFPQVDMRSINDWNWHKYGILFGIESNCSPEYHIINNRRCLKEHKLQWDRLSVLLTSSLKHLCCYLH